jgi:hypothetical protein
MTSLHLPSLAIATRCAQALTLDEFDGNAGSMNLGLSGEQALQIDSFFNDAGTRLRAG